MEENKVLWNIFGEGIEELWYFPLHIKEEHIKFYYKMYKESNDDSFEDFMAIIYPEVDCERVFVNEIWL